MNADDELRDVWHQSSGDVGVQLDVLRVVQERHRAFKELSTAENMGVYTVALSLTPLLVFAAWKAKTPFARFGFACYAAGFFAWCLLAYMSSRTPAAKRDKSVIEHTRELLSAYKLRIRFAKAIDLCGALMFSAGTVGVFFWSPHASSSMWSWVGSMSIIAILLISQQIIGRGNARRLHEKVAEAEQLLAQLEASSAPI